MPTCQAHVIIKDVIDDVNDTNVTNITNRLAILKDRVVAELCRIQAELLIEAFDADVGSNNNTASHHTSEMSAGRQAGICSMRPPHVV